MAVQERSRSNLPGRARAYVFGSKALSFSGQESFDRAFARAFRAALHASEQGYLTKEETVRIQRQLVALYVGGQITDMIDDLTFQLLPKAPRRKRRGDGSLITRISQSLKRMLAR